MGNIVEGRAVSDPFEAGEICAGLSHAYRMKVMHVLAQLGGKAKLADLIKECSEEGPYAVELKKAVKVFIKDIKCDR